MFYSIACHLLVLKEQRLPMDLQFLSKCNSTLTFSVRSKSNDSSNNSVKWTLFFPSTAKRKVISYLYELLELKNSSDHIFTSEDGNCSENKGGFVFLDEGNLKCSPKVQFICSLKFSPGSTGADS
jgi:hypothetical protein